IPPEAMRRRTVVLRSRRAAGAMGGAKSGLGATLSIRCKGEPEASATGGLAPPSASCSGRSRSRLAERTRIEELAMLIFLRDLLAHAEWANAVFFHAWGKSPARDQEEMRRRVDHIIGVQQGFLAILRGESPGRPPDGPPSSFDALKARAEASHVALRDFA